VEMVANIGPTRNCSWGGIVVGTHLVLGKRKNKNKIIRESADIVMQLIRASNLANGPIRHRISGRTNGIRLFPTADI